MTTLPPAVEILLVEDNPGDVRLTKELLRDAKTVNRVTVAGDGEEAMALLRGTSETRAFRPDLILLDINLPRKSGQEVLADVKQDETLRTIPVIVLTTSNAELDVVRSYRLHANGYIVKPVDLHRFVEIVHAIDTFWLAVVRLTNRSGGDAAAIA
jgi:CheY-like chemotaxis protein